MAKFEREKYGLRGIEQEPGDTRFALILEDDANILNYWIEAFGSIPGLRCIVPETRRGYSKGVADLIRPEQIVLIVADRFVDNVFVHVETANLIGWLRTVNQDVLIVETSLVRFRYPKYEGANLVICTFYKDFEPIVKAIKETERGWVEKLYTLQLMGVPEFLAAKKLDSLENEGLSEDEMFTLFFKLMESDQYHETISRIGISSDEVEAIFGRLDPRSAQVFLHCCFSIAGHLQLDHDEKYYAMAISRARMMLEDFKR